MDKETFKARTKAYAISVAKFCKSLSFDPVVKSYIDQLVRCSASVGANYRAACRAKSKPDFIHKMRIVEEEADETMYFLELLTEFYQDRKKEIETLHAEGNEIVAMVVSSINTTLKNLKS